MTNKYCPIMCYQNNEDCLTKCLENECVWWNEKEKNCCIQIITNSIISKKEKTTRYYDTDSKNCSW